MYHSEKVEGDYPDPSTVVAPSALSCEEKLRELAEQGLALNQAFRAARDAVQGTEERRSRWAAYNMLHVDMDKTCRDILKTSTAMPEPEPPAPSQEASALTATPEPLFDLGLDNPRLGAFR